MRALSCFKREPATFAPSRKNSRALASPMLPAPPVTTQTLFSKSGMAGYPR